MVHVNQWTRLESGTYIIASKPVVAFLPEAPIGCDTDQMPTSAFHLIFPPNKFLSSLCTNNSSVPSWIYNGGGFQEFVTPSSRPFLC